MIIANYISRYLSRSIYFEKEFDIRSISHHYLTHSSVAERMMTRSPYVNNDALYVKAEHRVIINSRNWNIFL